MKEIKWSVSYRCKKILQIKLEPSNAQNKTGVGTVSFSCEPFYLPVYLKLIYARKWQFESVQC